MLDRIATPSTLKEIGSGSFWWCRELVDLQLTEGLEYIGDYAFYCCDSLLRITIPTIVKRIGDKAFLGCRRMNHIELPSSVEEICPETFYDCSKLVLVELGEGLEQIRSEAFRCCSPVLESSTVNEIDPRAFEDCEHLVAVEFCEEIEDFLVEHGLNDWWNHGVAPMSLTTFNLLCQFNIVPRLKMLKAEKWWNNIHDMLERTPAVVSSDWRSGRKLEFHFRRIDRRLAVYESVRDIPIYWSWLYGNHHSSNNMNRMLLLTTSMARGSCSIVFVVVQMLLFPMCCRFYYIFQHSLCDGEVVDDKEFVKWNRDDTE